MAIARVGTGSGLLKTGSAAALIWTHSPTANNLLTFRATSWDSVAGNAEIGASSVTSVGGAGTFSRDVAAQTPTNTGEWALIYHLLAPSGVTSMQVASGGPIDIEGAFDEWSGNATTSVLDTTASTTNGSSVTSGNAGTLSTGASAGLCLAALNCDDGQGSAPTATGTGWTGDQNTGDQTGGDVLSTGLAFKLVSGSGSQQMTWTFGATPYGACSASYNAAASAAGPVGKAVIVQQAVRRASTI